MCIIARSTLRAFAARHPQARQPLDDWYKFADHAVWQTPADVKVYIRSADILPNNRTVYIRLIEIAQHRASHLCGAERTQRSLQEERCLRASHSYSHRTVWYAFDHT
jgi:hypothetical protein